MWLWLLISLGVVVADQLTKWLTVAFLEVGESVAVIPSVLNFTYVQNRGAAFGMLENNRWVFIVISLVAVSAMMFYLVKYRPRDGWLYVPLCMIAGGGFGNMIDRLTLHYVVDFINFELIDFYIFNGADSFVCVGAALLIFTLLIALIDEYKKEKEEKRKDGSGK